MNLNLDEQLMATALGDAIAKAIVSGASHYTFSEQIEKGVRAALIASNIVPVVLEAVTKALDVAITPIAEQSARTITQHLVGQATKLAQVTFARIEVDLLSSSSYTTEEKRKAMMAEAMARYAPPVTDAKEGT